MQLAPAARAAPAETLGASIPRAAPASPAGVAASTVAAAAAAAAATAAAAFEWPPSHRAEQRGGSRRDLGGSRRDLGGSRRISPAEAPISAELGGSDLGGSDLGGSRRVSPPISPAKAAKAASLAHEARS